jgi:hypothetical protein
MSSCRKLIFGPKEEKKFTKKGKKIWVSKMLTLILKWDNLPL